MKAKQAGGGIMSLFTTAALQSANAQLKDHLRKKEKTITTFKNLQ